MSALSRLWFALLLLLVALLGGVVQGFLDPLPLYVGGLLW